MKNRTIDVDENVSDVVVQGDSNSRIVSIVCNRYFDNVDLSEKKCSIVFKDSDSESGAEFNVTDENLEISDQKLEIKWLLDSRVSSSAGNLYFAIRFSESDVESKIVYMWQTKPAILSVTTGLNYLLEIPYADYEKEIKWFNENQLDIKYEQLIDEHDPYLVNNREVIVSTDREVAVSGDSNSQLLSFKMKRFFDGIDLSQMVPCIKYVNSEGAGDLSRAVNVRVEDDFIIISWLLSSKATLVPGNLQYQLCFIGYDEKENWYQWQTKPTSCIIAEGINGDQQPDIQPDVLENYLLMFDEKLRAASAEADRAERAANSVVYDLDGGSPDNIPRGIYDGGILT